MILFFGGEKVKVVIFLTLFLFDIIFISKFAVGAGKCKTPNVRTVLFHKSDLDKVCWCLEDVGLLLNRYIMQALLPKVVPRNMTIFLDYLLICLQTMDDIIESERTREIIVNAIADVFGGYLQCFGLPLANEVYYEGNADFKTVSELHVLEDDFKKLLNTDGGGWAKPMLIKSIVCPVCPLRVHSVRDACKKIIFNNVNSQREGKSCKRNGTTDIVNIPLPFLEDCKTPHAIAVPLVDRSLYSLTSRSSIGILTKYYEFGLSCIKESCKRNELKSTCDKRNREFSKRFSVWLKKYVVIHLHDDTWYPAFSNIIPLSMNVEKSLRRSVNGTEYENDCAGENGHSKLRAILNHPFLLFWLVVVILTIFCLLFRFCRCSKDVSDVDDCSCDCESSKEMLAEKRDSSNTFVNKNKDKSDDEKCPCCTCRTNAKASILAKFYCRKEQPCYDSNCPNKVSRSNCRDTDVMKSVSD